MRAAVVLAILATFTACGNDDEAGLKVTSVAFDDGGRIPERYSCLGENLSPPLQWSRVPFNTDEQAVVVHDPDAPSGTFYHWILVGLPGGTRSIGEGEVPAGTVQGVASSGKVGYIGMCPPNGQEHEYVFTVYALDEKVRLAEGVAPADALKAIEAQTVAKGELVGRFKAPSS